MMTVVQVKSVSGKPLYEVQHNGQTLSEPFINKADANWYMFHLGRLKGTKSDPLADYWARVEA
jgi:hypothetical protein